VERPPEERALEARPLEALPPDLLDPLERRPLPFLLPPPLCAISPPDREVLCPGSFPYKRTISC
jgi:hypothetical protein